jgi:streptogramin lyase
MSTSAVHADPRRSTLNATRVIETGKWPEGLTVDGDLAWLADSGDRRVLRVEWKTGQVSRLPVGRLPTQVERLDDGTLVALVETDKRLFRRAATGGAFVPLRRLPDCPDAMAVDGARVFVLLWTKCSSLGARIARVDARTGRARLSADLGRDGFDLAVHGDRAYVAHADGALSAVDTKTLKLQARWPVSGRPMHVRATSQAVFTHNAEGLVRLDPTTGQTTAAAPLAERVAALTLDGDLVYVALERGEVRTYLQADLTHVETFTLEPAPHAPRTLTVAQGHLFVTDHGEPSGRLLVFDRTQPGP